MIDLTETYPFDFIVHNAVDSLQASILLSRYIANTVSPTKAVDIGCAAGTLVSTLVSDGIDAIGFDGSPFAKDLHLCDDRLWIHDLRQPIPPELVSHRDVAISLEVAEHIEYDQSQQFIDNILAFSPDVIIFSSASLGMECHGHVNLQEDSFWDSMFGRESYMIDAEMTRDLKMLGYSGLVDYVKAKTEELGLRHLVEEGRAPETNAFATNAIFVPGWFRTNVRAFRKRA